METISPSPAHFHEYAGASGPGPSSTSGSQAMRSAPEVKATRLQVPFFPSTDELREAVCLLDQNMDGKVWEDDLDMLLQVAFGVDARRDGGSATWQQLKEDSECYDGLIDLNALLHAIESGLVHEEASRMVAWTETCSVRCAEAASTECAGPSEAAKSSFRNICEYVEAFNRFDCDRNGVICAKDLRFVLEQAMGVNLTLPQAKRIIQTIDTNFDGVVELNEFGALIEFLTSPESGVLTGLRPLMEYLTEPAEPAHIRSEAETGHAVVSHKSDVQVGFTRGSCTAGGKLSAESAEEIRCQLERVSLESTFAAVQPRKH